MSKLQKREAKISEELINEISLAELLHYVRKYYGWIKTQVIYTHHSDALEVSYILIFNELFKKQKSDLFRSFVFEIVNKLLSSKVY